MNITGTDQFPGLIKETGSAVAEANVKSSAAMNTIWASFLESWLIAAKELGFTGDQQGAFLAEVHAAIMGLGAAKVHAKVSARTSTESTEVKRLLASLALSYGGADLAGSLGFDYGTVGTRGVVAEAAIEVDAENLALGAEGWSKVGSIITDSALEDGQKQIALAILTAELHKYLGDDQKPGVLDLLPEPVRAKYETP